MSSEIVKKYVAELIGTFWLTLGGCGTAVIAASFPQTGVGLLGVSFGWGGGAAGRREWWGRRGRGVSALVTEVVLTMMFLCLHGGGEGAGGRDWDGLC